MIKMKSTSFYDRIVNVLRKMDEILNRKGILNYQDRIFKIIKFLMNLQRNSNNYVSNFSANKNEDKMQIDLIEGKEYYINMLNYIMSYLLYY